MAESGFKISDLDTIPVIKNKDGKVEKISLNDTYFLGYSHTIYGIKYTTQNYKIPLNVLRDDIKNLVINDIKKNGISGISGYISNINNFTNINSINISSDKTINVETSNFNNENSVDIKISVNRAALDLPDNTKIQSSDNSLEISNSSTDSSTWDIKALNHKIFLKEYTNNEKISNVDDHQFECLYIFPQDNDASIKFNFSNYLSDEYNESTRVIKIETIVNTSKLNTKEFISFHSSYIKWPEVKNGNSPKFYKNRLYSITIYSIPKHPLEGLDWVGPYDERLLIGKINWFAEM